MDEYIIKKYYDLINETYGDNITEEGKQKILEEIINKVEESRLKQSKKYKPIPKYIEIKKLNEINKMLIVDSETIKYNI